MEQKTNAPDFWQDQKKAQAVLQQRKQIEDRLGAQKAMDTRTSDIDTYFNLAQEASDDAQREALLADLSKELDAADKFLSELETKTLLAGESDRLNA
ncbi:MAG: PCRF domain-containing protein, partial [Candidatus Acidiferrales bacterium]